MMWKAKPPPPVWGTLGDSIKPIPIEPGLITYLSNPNYRYFLNRWRQAAVKD
jgi:hypothetical protein